MWLALRQVFPAGIVMSDVATIPILYGYAIELSSSMALTCNISPLVNMRLVVSVSSLKIISILLSSYVTVPLSIYG